MIVVFSRVTLIEIIRLVWNMGTFKINHKSNLFTLTINRKNISIGIVKILVGNMYNFLFKINYFWKYFWPKIKCLNYGKSKTSYI